MQKWAGSNMSVCLLSFQIEHICVGVGTEKLSQYTLRKCRCVVIYMTNLHVFSRLDRRQHFGLQNEKPLSQLSFCYAPGASQLPTHSLPFPHPQHPPSRPNTPF